MLTVKEAAKVARRSELVVYAAIHRGRLRATKRANGYLVIAESDLRAWSDGTWRKGITKNVRDSPQTIAAPAVSLPDHTKAQNAVMGLLHALPEDRRWTQQARNTWVAMLETVIDMTVATEG